MHKRTQTIINSHRNPTVTVN